MYVKQLATSGKAIQYLNYMDETTRQVGVASVVEGGSEAAGRAMFG